MNENVYAIEKSSLCSLKHGLLLRYETHFLFCLYFENIGDLKITNQSDGSISEFIVDKVLLYFPVKLICPNNYQFKLEFHHFFCLIEANS